MFEVIANSLEHALIDGLVCKLGKTASYITNRRSCAFDPQGRNLYAQTTGTTTHEYVLNGSDWLEPSTFRIMFLTHVTRMLMWLISFVPLVAQGLSFQD